MKSKTNKTEAAPVAMAEPVRQGRGGLRSYSEATADTVQQVRGEFLEDTFKPRITLTYKTMTFNTACVNLFPGCQHVTIGMDEQNRRLIVKATTDSDENGWKFAIFKNGKNVPRTCTVKFCTKLFEMMKWSPNAKCRILADVHEVDGMRVLVFDLEDSLLVFPASQKQRIDDLVKLLLRD